MMQQAGNLAFLRWCRIQVHQSLRLLPCSTTLIALYMLYRCLCGHGSAHMDRSMDGARELGYIHDIDGVDRCTCRLHDDCIDSCRFLPVTKGGQGAGKLMTTQCLRLGNFGVKKYYYMYTQFYCNATNACAYLTNMSATVLSDLLPKEQRSSRALKF